jgi:hypothetical protein
VAAIGYAIRYVQVDQEKSELGEKHQFLFYNEDEQRGGENVSTALKNTELYQLQNGGVSLGGNVEKI